MIAGNQLKVAHQKRSPESQAQAKARFGGWVRMISMSGTKANQMLWDWEEGGKADHKSRALTSVAVSFKIIMAD
jgi:hypothetical protein